MISLGAWHFPRPVVVLAPMAGVTDAPFRRLCLDFGADWAVAEMVSARPELLQSAYSQRRLMFSPGTPKVIQLLGSDMGQMQAAAQLAQDWGADMIDINLGCPAKSVHKQAAGSALLQDLRRVEALLRAVAQSVRVPVSIKTRLGYADKNGIFELGERAAAAGIQMIALHGRTRAQRFAGAVDYESMGRFAEVCPLPVLANGNIETAAQAQALLQCFPFAGIMIGRAARGNPQIFAQCRQFLDGRPPQNLTLADAQGHLRALHDFHGSAAVKIARQHLHAYAAQLGQAARLREAINAAPDAAAQQNLLLQFGFKENAACAASAA